MLPASSAARPGRAREVTRERRRRALALRAGDAEDTAAAALGQPQRGGGRDRQSRRSRSAAQLGAMDRDAGRAHHDVAPAERGQRPRRRRRCATSGAPSSDGDARGRGLLVEGRHGDARARQPPASLRGERGDLAAGAPDADRARLQAPRTARRSSSRPGGTSCSSLSASTAAGSPSGSGCAGSTSFASLRTTACSRQRGSSGQQPHRGEALLLLADALERLVPAARREQREALVLATRRRAGRRRRPRAGAPGELNGASARNTKRHFGQSRHQEDAAQGRVETEDRVAAREGAVVALHAARKRARWRARRPGAAPRTWRTPASVSATAAPSSRSAREALAELVVDLDPVPAQVARGGRALVGHRDGVEAVQRRRQQAPRR